MITIDYCVPQKVNPSGFLPSLQTSDGKSIDVDTVSIISYHAEWGTAANNTIITMVFPDVDQEVESFFLFNKLQSQNISYLQVIRNAVDKYFILAPGYVGRSSLLVDG